ncbi:KPN_02809 family neutral zinc metallopeptidase [Flavobacterium pallidum]|uniref:Metalloprotease n=1 Tax=Flavobacterium pallidum TaxID=2172098 RepID=A0A2S1SHA1_9FLAO|nr:neutral zinc metallopeptidase [Flavobacterium pallidum]AWI25788.1 metalloprotease [Flavobacterium pallidum]
MKWFGHRESGNMEDRRGMSGGGKAVAGGGILAVIAIIYSLLTGGDPSQLLQQVDTGTAQEQTRPLTSDEQELGKFMRVVLADTEEVWGKLFEEQGMTYEPPTLVLFNDGVSTGCGDAMSAAGPFYCPEDRKVYMDMVFFTELQSRFGAKGGDFAIAYVLAHEIGHHVQNLLGTSGRIHDLQQQTSESGANRLSVGLELQADFYAGIWAHYSEQRNKWLEAGDIEEALSAANAVGDDALQKRLQGHVVPDSFTHGTSAQRMMWFRKGFEGGDLQDGAALTE